MNLISELNIEQINASLISIRNEFRKNNVFEKGAGFSVSDTTRCFIVGGLLTTDATQIKFSIVLPKKIESQSIVVTELKTNIRCAGSYIPNTEYVEGGYDLVNNYKVIGSKVSDNIVGIVVESNSAFNATNNSALAVQINKITLRFE